MITSRDVAEASFPEVRWRVGYDVDEVRELLGAIRSTLEGYEAGAAVAEPVTARQLRHPNLQPTKFRLGWGMPEVDAFLRRVADTLEDYEERT